MTDFGGNTGTVATTVTVPDTATLARIKVLEDDKPIKDAKAQLLDSITAQPNDVIPNGGSVITSFGEYENATGSNVTLDATDPQTVASLTGRGLTKAAGGQSVVFEALADPQGNAAPAGKTIAVFDSKLYTVDGSGNWDEFAPDADSPVFVATTDPQDVAVTAGKTIAVFGSKLYMPVAGNWDEFASGSSPVLISTTDLQGVTVTAGKSFGVFGGRTYRDNAGTWDEIIAGGGYESISVSAPQALSPDDNKMIKRGYLISTVGATATGTVDQTPGAAEVVDYTLSDGTVIGQVIDLSWVGDVYVQVQGNIDGATNYLLHDLPRSVVSFIWDGATWQWLAEAASAEGQPDPATMTFN